MKRVMSRPNAAFEHTYCCSILCVELYDCVKHQRTARANFNACELVSYRFIDGRFYYLESNDSHWTCIYHKRRKETVSLNTPNLLEPLCCLEKMLFFSTGQFRVRKVGKDRGPRIYIGIRLKLSVRHGQSIRIHCPAISQLGLH